jgi:hypothetical protein
MGWQIGGRLLRARHAFWLALPAAIGGKMGLTLN